MNKPKVSTLAERKLREPVDQDVLYSAARGNERSNYELEFRTRNNETRYLLLLNATTGHNEQNDISGVVDVAQDVTEAAKHAREVHSMASELRAFVDTANALIFSVENVNEANNQTADIIRLSKDVTSSKPSDQSHVKKWNIKTAEITCYSKEEAETEMKDRAVGAIARELRQLVDTANAPIFGIDVHGNVNEWNFKTAEITGFSKEEAMNKPLVSTFVEPTLRQSVQEVFDNALKGNETSNYSLEFRTKGNEIRYLLVNAATRRDAENNISGVVSVAQDITEAEMKDRAVGAIARELRQLVDTANAPIFGIDVHGNVNEWNDKTAEITGFSKEEAMNKPLVSTFVEPKLRHSVQEVLDMALEGDGRSNYELEFRTKANEIRHLLLNATSRRDAEFKIVGVVGVAQDVTDDRKHSEELRDMQYIRAAQESRVETERNMTAYFAHELRNPLHAIDSALKLMPDELSLYAKNLVNAMNECTTFMSSIMNNLLDVRKMEEGKMVLKRVPLSLKALLDSVYSMLVASAHPGVKMTRVCETGGKDWVLGDAHRLQQVLTNVITNAIKYTTSGSIVLSIAWRGDMVRFECADDGPGIAKKDQSAIFQRFVKRGGAPGTGLGLAIAKHLVDLAEGHIGFESDPTVKAGTTCVVELPLKVCDRPEILEETKSPEAMIFNKVELIDEPITVLLVDDISMIRTMFRRRVKKGIAPNARVTEASNGEKALEICQEKTFDIIIVDQHMEEAGGIMLGTETVAEMRRLKIESIIIGCSGNDIDDEFMAAGSDWVMGKPTPSNSIIQKHFRQLLAARRLKRITLPFPSASLEVPSDS